jgi:hypothetical protein
VIGPVSERDLDVLFRTNAIEANTFAWKEGMKEWLPIKKIEHLKKSIEDSSTEIFKIQ